MASPSAFVRPESGYDFIGVDPGRTGARVYVDPRDGQRILHMDTWKDEDVPPRFGFWPLGWGEKAVVAIEGVHVGKSPYAALRLEFWCGQMARDLDDSCVLLRPQPMEWRGKVLRTPKCGKDRAIEAAFPALREYDPTIEVDDHMAEAWCIARFAWGWGRANLATRGVSQ